MEMRKTPERQATGWNAERSAILLTCLMAVAAPWDAGAPAAEAIRARDLSMQRGAADLIRLSLKTTGPVPSSRCEIRRENGLERLVLELPGVESGLKPTYEFAELMTGSIRVTTISTGADPGLRVEIPVQGLSLRGWQTSREGIEVSLSRSPAPGASVPAPPAEAVAGGYRLGPGDRVEMAVYGHDDMKQTLQVLSDGSIVLPLAGVIPVSGKTLEEVRQDLEKRLKDYLVDPQVSLDIKEYQSQPVNVVGEVEKPGQYFLKGPTTLVDIIALAGWMSKEAGSDVIITRHESVAGKAGAIRQIVIKKENLLGGGIEYNPTIQAGDVVTVGPRQYFYIRGEVTKPGQLVLEDHPTVMKAISLALGFTPYARKGGIHILRTVNGVQTRVDVDLKAIEERKQQDIPLLPDDVLVVPRRRI
jgi:polysaccharide export outer membrane protein